MTNIAGIDLESFSDGPRKGCTVMFRKNTGTIFSRRERSACVRYIAEAHDLTGVALVDGDSMRSAGGMLAFARRVKALVPAMELWWWTDLSYEDVARKSDRGAGLRSLLFFLRLKRLLGYCDVMASGPDGRRRFVDVKQSRAAGRPVLREVTPLE